MRPRTLRDPRWARPSRLSSPRRRARPRLAAVAVVLVAAVGLGGCNFSWPTFGASHGVDVQGHDVAKLYSGMFIAGLFVAAIVWGLIFWCVVMYRRKKNDDAIPPQTQEHIPLEITYTIIPLIMVVIIFVFTVITENAVDSVSHPAAATVTVTGYQWGWMFQYHKADGLTLRTAGAVRSLPAAGGYTAEVYPQLVIPDNETTKIILKSDDVIHDFFVPAFNFDRFAQPGVHNEFEYTPTQTGVYPGQCSEYCGLYHAEMLFSVRIVSPTKYKQWLTYQEHHLSQTPKHYALTQP
ncbi:MAG: cytochrome c oxidase subunit II [Acidimicrobiales bacterium]